ncbi:MAG: 2-oxoacid:acceptor oxidoreductase subunit alpha [bacterium]|nr:2-oxoacid:acceptor oxidoreductase subunit alpha [bacterium]
MTDSINIKIGGKAGEGIKTTGLILAKALSRLGFSLFAYDEYPSLIKGGHNTYQIYFGGEEVSSQHQKLDFLIAFDEQTLTLHQEELKSGAKVLFDPESFEAPKMEEVELLPIPWKKIALENAGSAQAFNMVALGAVVALLGLSANSLYEVITDVFGSKGEKVGQTNRKAAEDGASLVRENLNNFIQAVDLPLKASQIVVSGNEAIGAASIASGMKYFAAYPMTPVSSLFHFLADNAASYNFVSHHVESEVAAINTLIGASVAGVRAMTATSGGGFSLMVEGLGMTGVAEIPAVVVLGMRPGPATGMPTWTGQGDLRFALHASQDEFPRVVLAPGNPWEAFELTKKAFLLAEKYQLPVTILTDKYLCDSCKSGPFFPSDHQNKRFGFASELNGSFQRYALTSSGVSPRPVLGQKGGASLTNSYEHDETGLGSEESLDREKQMGKRLKKLVSLQEDLWELPLFGPPEAVTTLVGFGSTLGPVLEALKELPDTNYLHFNYLWPFPVSAQKHLEKAKSLVCLEGNAQGQLEGLIREQTGIKTDYALRKYNGRPFYPEEIVESVKNLKSK